MCTYTPKGGGDTYESFVRFLCTPRVYMCFSVEGESENERRSESRTHSSKEGAKEEREKKEREEERCSFGWKRKIRRYLNLSKEKGERKRNK